MSTPNKPNGNSDEIPIAQLIPSRLGAGMLHAGAMDKVLIARVKGKEGYANGYDITWVRQRRSFRVDHFNHDEPNGTRWIPEGRVDEYIEA